MMTHESFSRSPLWLKAIKRFGLPKDPNSKVSALENGEVVYVGWDGKVFAVDAEDGSTKWSRTLRRFGLSNSQAHQIDMIIQADFLYALWGDRVFRIHPTNGQVMEIRRTQTHSLGLWEV